MRPLSFAIAYTPMTTGSLWHINGNQYFTLGLFNRLAIVALAITFDRVFQAWAKRSQKHLHGVTHD